MLLYINTLIHQICYIFFIKKRLTSGQSLVLLKLLLILVWSVLERIKWRSVVAVVRLYEETLKLDLGILE